MSTPADSRFRCSLAARERGDVPVGTAVPAPYWFLVGHPGPWPTKAIDAEPLTEVAGRLSQQLNRFGARLQLVRRHGRLEGPLVESEGLQPVFLVDVRRGLIGRSTWRTPQDLVELAGRFDDLPDPSEEPLALVCTHARKDVCCAIEGRVVAAVLDDVLPGAVWETTHLGVDRFAGNTALLPEGSMYGQLDGDIAPQVVLDHFDGRVDLERWRGRSCWTPVAQVAVHDVLGSVPAARLADVAEPTQTDLGSGTWRVDIDLAGSVHSRLVTRTMSEAHVLTCSGAPKQQALFTVTMRA
ncbi:sucrase ferredoxin [Janibacter cremeus]|uniref:Sucrase ferredoxin n=1 Tax=Janibacter cremeus TaxID=1285192 RepID=A0A852VXI3_9MICO|nr:hypothetical protein [Janibacter cremeus]